MQRSMCGMRSLVSLVVAIASFLLHAHATTANGAEKTIDLRKATEAHHFALVFKSVSSTYDHAFVGFLADDDAERMSYERYFGFYPVGDVADKKWEATYEFFVTGVDGALEKETRAVYRTKATDSLTVLLNSSAYQKAKATLEKWQREKRYQLLFKDCVSFADAVAQAVGMKVPSRSFNPTPKAYISALLAAN